MNSPLRMREIEKRVSDAAPLVRFMGVQKSYDGTTLVVKGLDLDVARGEFLTLLGPSGSGKTTCLMMLAGFELPTAGEILLDGRPISRLPPNRRGIGVVFQNYALFPHMSVRQNVAYGLEAQHWPRDQVAPRLEKMLELVHMLPFAERLPRQLSGGQQQRVALARCLAVDPKILMLDEPFGALDKNLRLDMQIEVKKLHREYGITTILVTHDQEEALSMADRIAVMNRGRIEQVASSADIYDHPATLFVNQFVGTTNLLPGRIASSDASGTHVELPGGFLRAGAGRLAKGQEVVVSIRPEQLRVEREGASGRLSGTVKMVMPMGAQVIYDVEMPGGIAIKITQSRDSTRMPLASGSTIHFAPVSAEACHVFPAQAGMSKGS
jgi:putative spermidine/putrescine transport system ATP-binding protein